MPVANGHPASLPEQASIPQRPEQVARGLDHLTIVAVDDNADARAFIDQVLRLHGATAISVDTGVKAIEAVSQHHPDVVLCDLMMPEMDGYAVLRGIRALNDERAKNVPLVALTAFAGAENRLKTKETGFQFHLDKPIDPPQLIETIRALIKPSAR